MEKKKSLKKCKIFLIVIVFLLVVVCLWGSWENNSPQVSHYVIESQLIPKSFNGFKICQISDFHNARFGENNVNLLNLIKEQNPDIIVFTGDIVDCVHTNVERSVQFATDTAKICPTYYVSGNHEGQIKNYAELFSGIEKGGVKILNNQTINLEKNGEIIELIGVCDPHFSSKREKNAEKIAMDSNLKIAVKNTDNYKILLSHRPELFETYAQYSVDLVFSGHAHGGQFRLFGVGLVAPEQGLFPKLDAGKFIEKNTTMIVSRGLGNSIIPIRLNNRPELVVATLKSK